MAAADKGDWASTTKAEKKAEKKAAKTKEDPVRQKIASVFEEAREKGERRNSYMNLAWTGPVDNTYLGEKRTLGKVENMVAGLFFQ